jgi:hypothetical protein
MANKAVLELLKTKFKRAKACSGGSYRIECPTCEAGKAKKMKRYISPSYPTSNCFICGKILKVADLLKDGAATFSRSVSEPTSPEEDYPYARILPYTKLTELGSIPDTHPVIQFMRKDFLEAWSYYTQIGVGYIGTGDGTNITFESSDFKVNTSDSLYFPVFHNGERVGWQLRFIPGTVNGDRFQFMRYMHLFPKGEHLFNYDIAKNYDSVIVVEGAKKALKAANAVATLGKGISDTQKQLIQEWKRITLILDGEDNTQAQAQELAEQLRFNGRKCVNIDPRDYGVASPDEATSELIGKMVTDAWIHKN